MQARLFIGQAAEERQDVEKTLRLDRRQCESTHSGDAIVLSAETEDDECNNDNL